MKNFVQKGKNLTFVASGVTHPTHASPNLPLSGDQVVVGRVVGVVNNDALASTDNVVVSTEGIYNLSVTSKGNGLSLGETVFISHTDATLSEDPTETPFGVALDVVSAGQTKSIPIKLFGATPGATGYFS